MDPRLDDHVLQMRNLHIRYDLSQDVLELFRAYGEHHRSVEPPEALGRRLRTSTLMRTCTDTISALAVAMQKNPTPECMTECNEIITCCTEMLTIASILELSGLTVRVACENRVLTVLSQTSPAKTKVLPFLKLPPEIRQMVYGYYFKNLLQAPPWVQGKITLKGPVGCNCGTSDFKSYRKWDHGKGETLPLKMSLIYTCSYIKDEALKVWFEGRLFTFACSCELTHCLQINKIMRYHLENVRVHWRGEQSDSAFKLLQEVPKLKRLVVVISRSTTNEISGKETLLRKCWPNRRQTGISEALGFDELATLVGERRLENVKVEDVASTQSHRRSYQAGYGLQRLLSALAKGTRLEDRGYGGDSLQHS